MGVETKVEPRSRRTHAVPDRFRIALIGAGRISSHTHAPTVLACPRAELAALVDPVESNARSTAERFGIKPKISTRLADILSEVDAAIVATPNFTHCDLALECIAAGVPVFVEKPLATSTEEGERVVAAAEEAGVPVAVGYQTRFLPQTAILTDVIKNRTFGAVVRFAYQFGSKGNWAPVSGYNLDKRSAGGGVLTANGSHFLDRMISWFGYPDEAWLLDDSMGGPEANAAASFRWTSHDRPLAGSARFSRTVELPPGLVLESEQGTVLASDGRSATVVFRPADRPDLEMELRDTSAAAKDGLLEVDRQLDDFLDAIAEGRQPLVSARVGLESVRLLEHLYSHRTLMRDDWYSIEG